MKSESSESNCTTTFKAQKGSKDIVKNTPCDISGSSLIRIHFVCKENKNNDFIQHFFSSMSVFDTVAS